MRNRSFQTDRRTAIKSTAALFGLTGTGLGAIALTTDRARASVTAGLQIAGAQYASETGDIFTPYVFANGEWSFLIGEPAQGWQVELQFSSDGVDWERVATDGGPLDTTNASGSFDLAAAVIDHSAFDETTFDAGLGTTKETTVYVRTIFRALDAADATLIEARAAEAVAVSVENTTQEASASLSGDGETQLQVNSTDPTPTATGG